MFYQQTLVVTKHILYKLWYPCSRTITCHRRPLPRRPLSCLQHPPHSPPPWHAPPPPQSNTTRTLEDVWEDMTTQHSKLTTSCNMVLQDSLGAPLTPPPSSLPSLPVGPSQSPSPVLNLNSTLEFGLFDAGAHPDHLRGFPVGDLNHPYEDDFMGSQFLCSFGRKRLSAERDAGRADGRQKRLVKKRQSAARSRARKQAYITELQREVAHLTEENNWLRRLQQQQLQEQPVQETPALAQLRIPKEHQQKQDFSERYQRHFEKEKSSNFL